jgi:hypothetical protein
MTGFDELAQRYLGEPGVSEGQMFGMPILKCGGKVFAGDWHGELVVKLPRERVDALIGSGAGKPFTPMAGRVMKEWVLVEDEALAGEALAFVQGAT